MSSRLITNIFFLSVCWRDKIEIGEKNMRRGKKKKKIRNEIIGLADFVRDFTPTWQITRFR